MLPQPLSLPPGGFVALPLELLIQILGHLTWPEATLFGSTNRYFRGLVSHDPPMILDMWESRATNLGERRARRLVLRRS